MYNVAVIGMGYVGLSMAAFLGTKTNVVGIDKDRTKIENLQMGKNYFFEPELDYYLKKAVKKGLKFSSEINEDIINSDFIFVTVGTPLNNKNQINLEFVKSVIKSISEKFSKIHIKPTIIIKSTVLPGTTTDILEPILEKTGKISGKDFEILSNPEFLREGSAMDDTINPHVIVIGGKNKESRKNLLEFYKSVYPKNQEYVETNNTTAEMIKYANNAFLATKISFINSLANICQKITGTNVDDVAKVIGMDPRIGKLFLNAGPGYGGSCFPKDVQALISFSKKIGYEPELLQAVQEINKKQVVSIVKILQKNLRDLQGKKIGILGLSFKENTDDIRESVSIKLIDDLLRKKCQVIVHDPKAIKNTKDKFGERISYCEIFEDVFSIADCCILMTPWEEYKKITPNLIKKLKSKIFIDTRRVIENKDNEIKLISLGIGM